MLSFSILHNFVFLKILKKVKIMIKHGYKGTTLIEVKIHEVLRRAYQSSTLTVHELASNVPNID